MSGDWVIEQAGRNLTFKTSAGHKIITAHITGDDEEQGLQPTVDAINHQINQYMAGKLNVILNDEVKMPVGVAKIIKGIDVRQRSLRTISRANDRAKSMGGK
jgi:hypothetical protein